MSPVSDVDEPQPDLEDKATLSTGRPQVNSGYQKAPSNQHMKWLTQKFGQKLILTCIVMMAWIGWYIARKEAGGDVEPLKSLMETLKLVLMSAVGYVFAKAQDGTDRDDS